MTWTLWFGSPDGILWKRSKLAGPELLLRAGPPLCGDNVHSRIKQTPLFWSMPSRYFVLSAEWTPPKALGVFQANLLSLQLSWPLDLSRPSVEQRSLHYALSYVEVEALIVTQWLHTASSLSPVVLGVLFGGRWLSLSVGDYVMLAGSSVH